MLLICMLILFVTFDMVQRNSVQLYLMLMELKTKMTSLVAIQSRFLAWWQRVVTQAQVVSISSRWEDVERP